MNLASAVIMVMTILAKSCLVLICKKYGSDYRLDYGSLCSERSTVAILIIRYPTMMNLADDTQFI